MSLIKPKVLIDLVRPGKRHAKSRLLRVNLSNSGIINLPLITLSKIAVVGVVMSYLIFGTALAPIDRGQQSLAAQNDAERAQLEKQLSDLEDQIAKDQEVLSSYKSQGKGLQSEINALNAKVNKLNLQIKAINLSLKKLDNEISDNQVQILTTQQKMDLNKETLTRTMQDIYSSENMSMLEVLLRKPKLSDFFGDIADLGNLQESLRATLEKVINLRDELLSEKEALALKKNDAQQLKAYQDAQNKTLNSAKSEKASLLKVTKVNEANTLAGIIEKQKSASEIRNRIFRFSGGGELAFGEAVKIAQVAEKATGVRAALILAVLTQESSVKGVIGANLGKCYYNTPRNNASGTVMSNKQKPSFLALIASLGSNYNPDTTPVSCPIASDGAYGGAMGPAQFMPNTWDLYKDRISSITGGNPASPFNNLDAFTGTSLYLRDGLTGCQSIYTSIFSQENCSAAKYYAGGNWRSYMSVGRYGYRVAERAANFEEDILILGN